MDVEFILQLIFFILIGMILGSFSSALIWRVPRGLSWVMTKNADLKNDSKNEHRRFARSACPKCEHELGLKDLCPLFSWLFLKGQCRYCRHKISAIYPLAELTTILFCLGVFFVWGLTLQALILCLAMPFLVALIYIDAQHMILPNQLIIILLILGAVFSGYLYVSYGAAYGYDRQLVDKALGFVVFPLLSYGMSRFVSKLLRKDSMGLGDVKFFAAAGLWLGLSYLPFFLICSGVLGVLTGIFYRLSAKKALFPFGPALVVTLYICILLQGLEIIPFL